MLGVSLTGMDPTIRFAELVAGPEQELLLDEASLLIAAHARPDLDIRAELKLLDRLAAGIPEGTLEEWRRHLFVDLGYSGDIGRYYDPANSFLNEVIRRRRGLPITLSVLGMEVGRRVGLRLLGVGMPGHFLLKHGPDVYVDPFDAGRVLDRSECIDRFRAVNGPRAAFRTGYLEPVGPHAILGRMLNNLKAVYAGRGDVAALNWVFELRRALPAAGPGEAREWARTLGATGRYLEAAAELEALAEAHPGDAEALEAEAAAFRAHLN
jgi:regulator of sirC expression with transglutaminase-like and TPR domain